MNTFMMKYSTFCAVECTANYLVGVSHISCGATCSSSISNCASCSNTTNCTACKPFFDITGNGASCTINCTTISLCLTCQMNLTLLNCITCQSGYHSNFTHCKPQCGDGVYTPDETCEDGNSANSDGCSSLCVFESGFYCNVSAVNFSTCASCPSTISSCVTCLSGTNCTLCSPFYDITGNGTSCTINCTTISLCLTCQVVSTQLHCIICNSGYYSNNTHCNPQCGEGILTPD